MGKPGVSDTDVTHLYRRERTWGTETFSVPRGREINRDALSSGERKGPEPKPRVFAPEGL